jgi:hypothetical protein
MATAGLSVNEESSYDEAASKNSKDVVDQELGAAILTEAERNRLLRKIDLHILPFVSLLYLLSFLCVIFLRRIVPSYLPFFQGSGEYRLAYFDCFVSQTPIQLTRQRENCRHGCGCALDWIEVQCRMSKQMFKFTSSTY